MKRASTAATVLLFAGLFVMWAIRGGIARVFKLSGTLHARNMSLQPEFTYEILKREKEVHLKGSVKKLRLQNNINI